MLISITGNIASGKSTLATKLRRKLKGYKIIKADTYRKRYNKEGSALGELVVWEHITRKLKKGGNYILEMTGVGKQYERCLAVYPGPTYTILVDKSIEDCYKQHQERIKKGYQLPPMHFTRDIRDGMAAIDNLLHTVQVDYIYEKNSDWDGLIMELQAYVT